MKQASTPFRLVAGCQGNGGPERRASVKSTHGFTLIEVCVALGILTVLFAGTLTAYVQMARQAEWAGYSLAAQSINIQQIERARSAVWDYSINKNEITNMNLMGWSYNGTTKVGTGYTTNILDIPISGTNYVRVTNYVTIKMLSVTGVSSVQVQMVKVDTVWPLLSLRYGKRFYTNTTASYFGPDNRDMSSL